MYYPNDTVFITDANELDPIPKGSIGKVVESVGDGFYEVKFDGISHNNSYKDKYTWTVHESELAPFNRDFRLVKNDSPSFEPPTLTIPLVNGVEQLTGEFQDSQGDVYYVSVTKLNVKQQE